MIYCCKLLVVQSSSTLHSLLVSSFRQTYHVAAFSSCKVSVYLVMKHQPPQHTVHRLSNSQQWHSHTRKSVPVVLASCRDILYFVWQYSCILLFKTERVLSAIQQTSFCQLWGNSTNN